MKRIFNNPAIITRYCRRAGRLGEVNRCSFEKIESTPIAKGIIVSLTSYGSRLETVHLSIKSVLSQTLRPQAIALYLAESENEARITPQLKSLEQFGLRIVYGVTEYRSHNKYYYAFADYPSSSIITIDDDLLYPPDYIESFVRAQRVVGECVFARRTHKITLDSSGKLKKYCEWEGEWSSDDYVPRHSLLATTGHGSMYIPEVIKKLESDPRDFMKYSPSADDIWLKFVEVNAGIKVVHVPNTCNTPYLIPGTQDTSLTAYNVGDGGNDKAISLLMEHFNLEPSVFLD